MDLLKDWRRRIFGAAAGAVVTPVAILLAALAVGVGGGGLRGIGSVSQAFQGPEAPAIAPAEGSRNRAAAEESGRLLTRVQRQAERAQRRAAARAKGRGDNPRRPSAGAPGGTGGRPPTSGRPGTTGAPSPGGSPAPQPQPQPPAPQPTPTPGTIREVGEQVKQVTDPVPVVGPPAGEVVDLIVDTAESLPVPPLKR
jgi:hypothetical protein